VTATSNRWLDQRQQGVWRAYLTGTTLLNERLDRDLRELHDLSLPEYEVLVRLSESPDRRLRMAELATSLHHSRSRITHTVARMEGEGLVRRASCPTDRRGVIAELTDAGYARLVDSAPTHVAGVREHFVDVADPDDFAAVGRVFRAVIAALAGADEPKTAVTAG
jgi:DNA-binding MarR family transcriptional regulator